MARLPAIGVVAALCCGVVCSPLAEGGVADSTGIHAKGTAWATSRGPDTVTAFDGATGRVLATVPVGKAPMGLAVPRGANKLYVGNEGSNSVSVISVPRREVIATINVGSRPHHMYASPDGSRVYVAEFGTNKIGVIDTMTDSLVAEWATGPSTERTHAPAPAQDGKTVYAVNSGTNKLVALDAQTGAIQWSMPTGDNPSEFHVLHDGRTGYLSVRNLDEIDEIDLVARQVVRRIPVGDQPDTVQIAPDESFLVVALRATPAEVDVIDLPDVSVSKVVFPGVRLTGHNWLSANGRYTFVSLDDPGGVGVIDHRTNSIVTTWPYPGGGSVHGMFYDDPRATGGPGLSMPRRGALVGRSGAARVPVACAEETAGSCRGTLSLAKGRQALGSARFALRVGTSASVAVKLTGRALKALARNGTLAARATAKASDTFEHENKVSRTIVLRRAPR
jgi:YVTN family beta-propeller protein